MLPNLIYHYYYYYQHDYGCIWLYKPQTAKFLHHKTFVRVCICYLILKYTFYSIYHSFPVIYILYYFLVAKFVPQFLSYLLFHLISFLISIYLASSILLSDFFLSFAHSFFHFSLSGRDVGSILYLTSPFSCTQPPANKSRTGDLWPVRSMLAWGPHGSAATDWGTLIALQNTASDFRHSWARWTGVIMNGSL